MVVQRFFSRSRVSNPKTKFFFLFFGLYVFFGRYSGTSILFLGLVLKSLPSRNFLNILKIRQCILIVLKKSHVIWKIVVITIFLVNGLQTKKKLLFRKKIFIFLSGGSGIFRSKFQNSHILIVFGIKKSIFSQLFRFFKILMCFWSIFKKYSRFSKVFSGKTMHFKKCFFPKNAIRENFLFRKKNLFYFGGGFLEFFGFCGANFGTLLFFPGVAIKRSTSLQNFWFFVSERGLAV